MKELDYSHCITYFVPLCTKNRAWILSDIVGRDDLIPPTVELTEYGVAAERFIQNIPYCYDSVAVLQYIIMPNHIHMLVKISNIASGLRSSDVGKSGGMRSSRPTLQNVVRAFKSLTTKSIGLSMWQNSFHDHIIRSEKDYVYYSKYIKDNPANWFNDVYYNDK